MDNMRGLYDDEDQDYDSDPDAFDHDDDAVMDAPHAFGTDERRMHVRAYNYWAKLLGDRQFPSIEDLDPENIEDFGPHSVLLDFTTGMENPAIPFVGDALRTECELERDISYLDQVPGRSLLSRITDHFLQIVANKAPIGFEAEFVNQRGVSIMYRGILLPFSSDDDGIDFIYGVINWKEIADQATTDALIKDIDKAVAAAPRKATIPVWDDSPDDDLAPGSLCDPVRPGRAKTPLLLSSMEMDDFPDDTPDASSELLDLDLAAIVDESPEPLTPDEDANLADWLFYTRELAALAMVAEDRSRSALYQAIGRAYDFALLSRQLPDEFSELIEDAGLKVQARAPMTPVVKLIFGADYEKTRIAEYSIVLSFAMRENIAQGELAGRLESHDGGLKAIVQHERALRRKKPVKSRANEQYEQACEKLRSVTGRSLSEVDAGNSEFVVLVARRDADGHLGVVGSIDSADTLAAQVLRKVAS